MIGQIRVSLGPLQKLRAYRAGTLGPAIRTLGPS